MNCSKFLSQFRSGTIQKRREQKYLAVDETDDASCLYLLVGPSTTLADDVLTPRLERATGLERLIVASALGLVGVRVPGPLDFLQLSLPEEDDEICSFAGQGDEEQASNHLEAGGVVDVLQVGSNVGRRDHRTDEGRKNESQYKR